MSMDKLTDKLTEYLSAFESATKAYAPDVVDSGLKVVQLDCIGTLVMWFVVLLVLAIVWKITLPIIKRGVESYHDDSAGYIGWVIFQGVATFFLVMIAIANLLSFWTWVGVFDTKLYIAHQVMEKILK